MSVALTVRSDQWSDDRKSIAGRFQLQRYKQRYRLLEYKVHSRKRRATTQSWSFLEQRPKRKTKRRERQSDVARKARTLVARASEGAPAKQVSTPRCRGQLGRERLRRRSDESGGRARARRGAGRGSAITALMFLSCSNSLARRSGAFFIQYRVHYLSPRPARTRGRLVAPRRTGRCFIASRRF